MVSDGSDRAATARVERPDRLGLLCHDVLHANFLTALLYIVRPDLPVDVLMTLPDLENWVAGAATPASRLVAFCTSVVVPGGVLATLGGPAYNFHPGPPAYPGKFPAAFALYDGASEFGATLHQMVTRVDSGPIVGVTSFPIPAGAGYPWLTARAHQAVLHLFFHAARDLAHSAAPLPTLPVTWSDRRCSQKALDALLHVTPDIEAEELDRRHRIFGQIPGAVVYLTVQGRRFQLVADPPVPA
jgi:methionyl-tRNA formyltransferase